MRAGCLKFCLHLLELWSERVLTGLKASVMRQNNCVDSRAALGSDQDVHDLGSKY